MKNHHHSTVSQFTYIFPFCSIAKDFNDNNRRDDVVDYDDDDDVDNYDIKFTSLGIWQNPTVNVKRTEFPRLHKICIPCSCFNFYLSLLYIILQLLLLLLLLLSLGII